MITNAKRDTQTWPLKMIPKNSVLNDNRKNQKKKKMRWKPLVIHLTKDRRSKIISSRHSTHIQFRTDRSHLTYLLDTWNAIQNTCSSKIESQAMIPFGNYRTKISKLQLIPSLITWNFTIHLKCNDVVSVVSFMCVCVRNENMKIGKHYLHSLPPERVCPFRCSYFFFLFPNDQYLLFSCGEYLFGAHTTESYTYNISNGRWGTRR